MRRNIFIIKSFLLFFVISVSLTSTGQAENNLKDTASLKARAEQGDAKAQLDYGDFLNKEYYKDFRNPDNQVYRTEAEEWVKKAAKQDLPEAIFYLGFSGIGEKPKQYYYELAARKGYASAFDYVFDDLLLSGPMSDIKRAKEFADLARQMGIKPPVHSNLEIVDICYKAGKPDTMYDTALYPGEVYDLCRELENNPNKHINCIFEKGNNIDIAELYANGISVKQDLWKAISYVCHGSEILAELVSMVNLLHKAAEIGKLEEDFEYCNHAASRDNINVCGRRGTHKSFRAIKVTPK